MIETEKEKQFWERVIVTKSCWIFFQPNSYEYGRFGSMSAHRFIWTGVLGRVAPKGLELHHNCKNKRCVNPGHLELVTRKEHRNKHGALTPDEIAQVIEKVISTEMSRSEAAKHFNVSRATITRIVSPYIDALIHRVLKM